MANSANLTVLCLDGIWRTIYIHEISSPDQFLNLLRKSYSKVEIIEKVLELGNCYKLGSTNKIIESWRGWDGDSHYMTEDASYFYKFRTDSELLQKSCEARESLNLLIGEEKYIFIGYCDSNGCYYNEYEYDFDDCDADERIKFYKELETVAEARRKQSGTKPKKPVVLDKIDDFRGNFYFLSNFYPSPVNFEGLIYQSSEAAYQAAKTNNKTIRNIFTKCTANESKVLGKSITLRPDWEDIKLDVMDRILREKFRNAQLYQRLLKTGNIPLIEGNTWNDTFWGVCNGKGENNLGKLLMKIREEIKDQNTF